MAYKEQGLGSRKKIVCNRYKMAYSSIKDFLAVVVLYNTPIESCTTLETLDNSAFVLNEKLDVIVHDNSPAQQNQIKSNYKNLTLLYHHDVTNSGVSRAYNTAVKNGKAKGKKFILLLDQDTCFSNDSLPKYLEAINTHKNTTLFCPILKSNGRIYSPSKYIFRRGVHWDEVVPGEYLLNNKTALNSGLLVNIDAYLAVGGYNEKIKLYFSDFDFINRFRKKFKRFVVIDSVCNHSLSDLEKKDVASAIQRFKYYVTGSYYSISTVIDYFFLFATIFLRSLKLVVKFKNARFLSIFFKRYLLGKAV